MSVNQLETNNKKSVTKKKRWVQSTLFTTIARSSTSTLPLAEAEVMAVSQEENEDDINIKAKSDDSVSIQFTCNECGNNKFRSKRSLRVHLKRHMQKEKKLYDICESENRRTNKKRTKNTNNGKRIQRYKASWSEHFPWVKEATIGPFYAICTVCNKNLRIAKDGITALRRHEKGIGHKYSSRIVSKNNDEGNLLKMHTDLLTVTQRARKVEIATSLFIASKNLPFSLSNDLIEFLKSIDIDERVKRELTLHETKCVGIIRNVTGKVAFHNLIEILRQQRFSLIIDESTDLSSTKHLALTVRYRRKSDFEVCDQFLTLLEVHNASALALYNLIINFFKDHEIPYRKNMVGFGSDGANVMFGEKMSVAALQKKNISSLFLMKCICHSLALAASHASKELPSYLHNLSNRIYRYLKHSSKKQDILKKFQNLLSIPEHKILRLFNIRWLSVASVVARLLEQCDALFLFFENERKKKLKPEVVAEAEEIFKILESRFTILYLHFLNFVMPLVTKRNKEFQSEKPRIQELHSKMTSLFKTITGFYLSEEYVDRTDPEFITYSEELRTEDVKIYWEHLKNIDLGPTVAAELSCLATKVSPQKLDDFRNTCRKFYIQLATEIMKRFPFGQPEIQCMTKFSFLEPSNIKNIRNISEIASMLKLDVEDVHREYKDLRTRMKNNYETDHQKFWKKVSSLQTPDGIEEYPLMNVIVETISVFPHSSAVVERIFSAINLNKTKVRNCLSTQSLIGLLHSFII